MNVYDRINNHPGGMEGWIADDPDNRGNCELCGEVYDHMGEPSIAEVGEFVKHIESYGADGVKLSDNYPIHVIAHAQCGLDQGLEMA